MSDISLPDPPFAAETEVTIRARMLAAVDPSYSTDVGDIIYDMLTPAAIEMDRIYDAMEIFMGEAFVVTASGTFLDAIGVQLTRLTRLTDETDASYRARQLVRLAAPIGAGNVADYGVWAMETGVVGFVTVTPVWSGAGTVRVLVATSGRAALSSPDLTIVEDYIATKSPIGATVTVASITTDTVSIDAVMTFKPGYSADDAMFNKCVLHLLDYINTLGPGDDVIYNEVIRYLLEVDGTADVTSLDINTAGVTLAIAATHLAVFPSDGSTFTLS